MRHTALRRELGLAVLLAVVAASLAACGSSVSPAPASGLTSPVSAPSSTSFSATDDGLTLAVSFDSVTVAPGGPVIAHVTVTNDRPNAVVYGRQQCGSPATMVVRLDLQLEPAGLRWTGIAGTFKQYALTQGYGAAGVKATDPVPVAIPLIPCGPAHGDGTLDARASLTTSLTWKAEIVDGVAALPGTVPFTITFDHDPLPRPSQPTAPPSPTPFRPPGLWIEQYHHLAVDGNLQIAGPAPKIVSAGEAIDALLANGGFADWLAKQPESSWANANLFLESYPTAEGITPAGPSWDIELFRNPRNFAIAHIDPFTDVVRSINYCNIPCSR